MAVSSTHSISVVLSTLRTRNLPSINDPVSRLSNPASIGYLSRGAYPRRPFVITFSYKSNYELPLDKKRQLLEQYGLDLDDFMSDPSPKPKRRKEQAKNRRGKAVVPEETKPPPETHRLLQVLGGMA